MNNILFDLGECSSNIISTYNYVEDPTSITKNTNKKSEKEETEYDPPFLSMLPLRSYVQNEKLFLKELYRYIQNQFSEDVIVDDEKKSDPSQTLVHCKKKLF